MDVVVHDPDVLGLGASRHPVPIILVPIIGIAVIVNVIAVDDNVMAAAGSMMMAVKEIS